MNKINIAELKSDDVRTWFAIPIIVYSLKHPDKLNKITRWTKQLDEILDDVKQGESED